MKKLLLLLIMSLSVFGQSFDENLYPQIPNNAVSVDTIFYKCWNESTLQKINFDYPD